MSRSGYKRLIVAFAVVSTAFCLFAIAYSQWLNPRVIEELRSNPNGERAQKVMILTLPSGKVRPVNYLRDGRSIYAAADFPWWRELDGGSQHATAWIKGETLDGTIRAVTDDPALRDSVFERLRPTAPRWAGTLVVITLD